MRCIKMLQVAALFFIYSSTSQSAVLTFSVSPSGGGTTVPVNGSTHTLVEGFHDITATPGTNWRFVSWTYDPPRVGTMYISNSTLATTIMYVSTDVVTTVTANFAKLTSNLAMVVSPANSGTTTPAVGVVTSVAWNVSQAIVATAVAPYVFDRWEANPKGNATIASYTAASTTVALTNDTTVTAYFRMPGGGPVLVYDLVRKGNFISNAGGEYFREFPQTIIGLFVVNYNEYQDQYPIGFNSAYMLQFWEFNNGKYYMVEPFEATFDIRRGVKGGDEFTIKRIMPTDATNSGYAEYYYSGKMKKERASLLGLDSTQVPGLFVSKHIKGSLIVQSFGSSDVYSGGFPSTGSAYMDLVLNYDRTKAANNNGAPLATEQIIIERVDQLKRKGYMAY